jgi:hypothetical protein
MATSKSVLQRLKPLVLGEANVVAEATTYKHSRILTLGPCLCVARSGFCLRFGYDRQ